MARISPAVAASILILLACLALSVEVAGSAGRESGSVLRRSEAGTIRLDDCLDQAVVNGLSPEDHEAGALVLHAIEWTEASAFEPAEPTASVEVDPAEDCVRLSGSGDRPRFRLKTGDLDLLKVGMVVIRVRSNEVRRFTLSSPSAMDSFGLARLPRPPAQVPARESSTEEEQDSRIDPAQDATATGGEIPGEDRPDERSPLPSAGQDAVAAVNLTGAGRVVFGGPGGFSAPERTVFEVPGDGEWHTLARPMSELIGGAGPGFVNSPGAAGPRNPELLLTLLDAREGAALEVEFLHFLDPRSLYAHAVAEKTTLDRNDTFRSGMFLWTPGDVTWRIPVEPGARLSTSVAAVTDHPFTLTVSITTNGARRSLFERTFESASAIEQVEVDLAEFSGQEAALTLEVVEEEEPTVALLLRPMILFPRSEQVRNVIVYFCDTLRADSLSCYGYPERITPHLDRLASEGIRFERCFAQGSWTYVSMPSALTSLPPSANGVKGGFESLPLSVTTLAEAFRARGYLTAAFVTNDFVGRQTSLDQGFDEFFTTAAVRGSKPRANTDADQAPAAERPFLGFGQPQFAQVGNGFAIGSARDIHDKIEHWLEENQGAPFFVLLHAVDPHDPFDPAVGDRRRFLSDEEDRQYGKDQTALEQARGRRFGGPMGGGMIVTQVVANAGGPAPQAAFPASVRAELLESGIDAGQHASRTRRLYDAEVAAFDVQVGRLLDLLDHRKLAASTLVSFHSDHGEEFLEHDNMGHGHSMYSELIKVPWLLRLPGALPADRVIGDNVANLDLAPTLLGLCGFTPAQGMQGRDLSAFLLGGAEIPSARIVSEQWAGAGPSASDFGTLSVVDGRYRILVRMGGDPDPEKRRPSTGRTAPQNPGPDIQVFDLLSDPLDLVDLAKDHQELAQAIKDWLREWLEHQRQTLESLGGADSSRSKEAVDLLRALGYAE